MTFLNRHLHPRLYKTSNTTPPKTQNAPFPDSKQNSPLETTSHILLLTCIFFISSADKAASALEFMVGGIDSWIVPHDNDTSYYNEWASETRFRLNDMINFRYKKDSVMEVRPQDFKIPIPSLSPYGFCCCNQ